MKYYNLVQKRTLYQLAGKANLNVCKRLQTFTNDYQTTLLLIVSHLAKYQTHAYNTHKEQFPMGSLWAILTRC